VAPDKQIIAIIAYLHKLGRDISENNATSSLDINK